jgi:hypothetical protein
MTLISEDLRRWEPLVFRNWLPLESDDALFANEDDLVVRFWIDETSLRSPINPENVGRHGNLTVARLYVSVSGIDVSDDLAELIAAFSSETNWTPEHIEATYDARLVYEYSALSLRLYSAVIKHFNRFIAYVRAVKGQYWLQEYRPDTHNLSSEFLKLSGMIQVGTSAWVRLTAAGVLQWTAGPGGPERFIRKEDWSGIREHMSGQRNAPLVGQLLAVAEEFRELGHRRASLTEAVAALEIAVSQFAQQAMPEKWSTLIADRTSAESFGTHVNHLGITCTVAYLFPVLFTEDQIPASVLKACQAAIKERQTVIHQGQRDVPDDRLAGYLRAIRDVCIRLRRLSASAE